MNFHAPISIATSGAAMAAAMPKGVPVRDLVVRVGAIIDYDEFTLPSGELYYGGVEIVTALRDGEVRVKGQGWLPASGVRQVLSGFTVGKTDVEYDAHDEAVLGLFERAEKVDANRAAMQTEFDQAYDRYQRVCAGRGITDSEPDGTIIKPRERLLEVRRLEQAVMVETGYEEVANRRGRLDMLAAMLRTAILMMPVNTSQGAAAKLETLIRDYEHFEMDGCYIEKQRAILNEMRQIKTETPTSRPTQVDLPTDIHEVPIGSLFHVAQGLDMASSLLAHMADMSVIEDRRASHFMEEVGNSVRSTWTSLIEHVHGRTPADEHEAAARNFMVVSARLNCGSLADVDIVGPGATEWLADRATNSKAA